MIESVILKNGLEVKKKAIKYIFQLIRFIYSLGNCKTLLLYFKRFKFKYEYEIRFLYNFKKISKKVVLECIKFLK